MNEIKKTTLHPDNQPNTDLYPKTSAEQVEGLREFVEQYSSDINLENGTGYVLIQTTDTNHSFKVMKDGRAKVKAAPIDNDDAVRLEDINNKYVRRYKAQVISERRAYAVNPNGFDETIPIHISALGDDLPIRTSNGQLKTNAPIDNDDCANKKYVDDNIASHSSGGKLYKHNYTFSVGDGSYVYCTTYKSTNTAMTSTEVLNYFSSHVTGGRVVLVGVVQNYTSGTFGYFQNVTGPDTYDVYTGSDTTIFSISPSTAMSHAITEV